MNERIAQDLSRVLAAHLKEYPKAQPIDCIKLCYQRAFGAAHFCGTPKQSLDARKALRCRESVIVSGISGYTKAV